MLLVNLSILANKPTGISVYTQNVSQHFAQLHPTFLTNQPEYQSSAYPIPPQLSPDFGLKAHLRRLWWTQFTLPKIYQKLNADLIFSPLPEAPLLTDCRTVVMVHDLIPLRYPDRRSPLQYYQKLILPHILNQAQHLVCNSQSTADDVIKFFQIPATKMTPIPLAYDRQQFRVIPNLPSPEIPYFLYLGRHNPHKNVERMIRAFAQLKNYQDYQFWLVGSTDKRYTPQLQTLIQTLGLEKQVLFKEYIPHHVLPQVINQALCLVFTTLWEGFGLPVLEAMACGTPVITSNQSALPEVAGEAALLVNPQSIAAITDAMQAIATQPNLHQDLRQRGLAQAQQFSWATTGKATAQLLSQFT